VEEWRKLKVPQQEEKTMNSLTSALKWRRLH